MLRSNSGFPVTTDFIIEKTRTVYTLPLLYERLNEAINHPRSSIHDISGIIMEDQGLTTRLLKLANSPVFGCYSKVDSITRAVTIIGTQQVRDLALAASVVGVFRGIPEGLMSMPSFWKHSIACGIIARTLALHRREANVERYFVSGLLHDVGQVVMVAVCPELTLEVLECHSGSGRLYVELEREHLGFDHADLGGALLRKWKIPNSITEPVALHHLPGAAEQFRSEASLIHLADIICQAMGFGQGAEHTVMPLDEQAWDRLGFPPQMLSTIVAQSEPLIDETFSILSGEADA